MYRNPSACVLVGKFFADIPNVRLLDPLDYLPRVQLMKRAHPVPTNSDGPQEKAPGLGKHVLFPCKVTERQEDVAAVRLKLVDMDADNIVPDTSRLLDDLEITA